MSEKLCGVKKTKYADAYLKYELLEMVYKKMQKGKFKDITKTQAKNMTISQLCKLLKIKVTKQEDIKEPEKASVNLDKVCTPRRVKEYPNSYSKAELVQLALDRRLSSVSQSKKMNIKSLCKLLKIKYVDVPVKSSKKKKKESPVKSEDIEDEEEEDDQSESFEEEEEPKCISDSKLPLKDHQKIVANFLNEKDNRGLLVLHPVGTGKTLTAVTVSQCFLKKNPNSKVIVVTPTSLQGNFKKGLLKDYGAEDIDRYQFYTIQSFVIASKRGKINCNNKLLILDEAHNIRTRIRKSKKGQEGVNAIELLKCASKSKKVLLLSATPSINSAYDMLNLFAMIEGKEQPITPLEFYRMKPSEIIRYLKCKVSIYTPTEEEIKKSFPEKDEEEIFLKMGPDYYQKYIEVLDNKIGEDHRFSLFGGTDNLIPFYNGVRRAVNNLEEKNSPKVNWIMKKIVSNKKSKFLIFSHFLGSGVELLEKRLKESDINYVSINGSMSKKKRDDAVSKYNKGKVKILLISKAGGEGLDLKETNYVIIMEPAWNESAMEQVIGRAVRMGSHSRLPKEQRVVKIYTLFMLQPDEKEYLDDILDGHLLESPNGDILSIDIFLRNLAFTKQRKIDKFLAKLTKLSIEEIDCKKKLDLKDPYFNEFFEKEKKTDISKPNSEDSEDSDDSEESDDSEDSEDSDDSDDEPLFSDSEDD